MNVVGYKDKKPNNPLADHLNQAPVDEDLTIKL